MINIPLPLEIVGCLILPYLGPDLDKIQTWLVTQDVLKHMLNKTFVGRSHSIFLELLLQQNTLGPSECLWKAASRHEPIETLKYFLDQKADIHVHNDCALISASYQQAFYYWDPLMKMFKKRPGNSAIQKEVLSWDANQRAVYRNGAAVVKFLVENKANVNAHDDRALQEASCSGALDTVKFLVEHKANVHADFDYAVGIAHAKRHTDVVKFLLEHKATLGKLPHSQIHHLYE